MPKIEFLTVPEELVEHAAEIAENFSDRGFRIQAEPFALEFPYSPTLLCKRGRTTVIVEVESSVNRKKLEEWARYAASCTADTQVALALPETAAISGHDIAFLQEQRIGLYVTGAGGVVERVPPMDLALNVRLPDLRSLPEKVRAALGPVYEQFGRTQWREAFEEACQTLEVEARRYLKRGVGTGRVVVMSPGGKVLTLTTEKIDRMTLGGLAAAYAGIQTPNRTDVAVAQALELINPDRVGVAHHKRKARTESRLRKNAGRHFYAVIGALKYLLG